LSPSCFSPLSLHDALPISDFHGAMDGASKFVRGDAIAGILILVINLVGGVAIGALMHDLSFGDSLRQYALLTIGDGLVAQIPALDRKSTRLNSSHVKISYA